MTVTFSIHYETHWGEALILRSKDFQAYSLSRVQPMQWNTGGVWQLTLILPDSVKELSYEYALQNDDRTLLYESTRYGHHVTFNALSCHINDFWLLPAGNRVFYTSAFTNNVFARKQSKSTVVSDDSLLITVAAPTIKPHQQLAIVGNQLRLGNWNPEIAPVMSDALFPIWQIQLKLGEITFPLEYKFIIRDIKTCTTVCWEKGANRVISNHTNANLLIINDYPFNNNFTDWKATGTVTPLFSLRSENSFGIGDIGDLKLFIDWAKQSDMNLIQLLPVNDTTRTHTWHDSYPYSGISVFALHPLYISIPMLNGGLKNKRKASDYEKKRLSLNNCQTVDYEQVEKYKSAYLRDYYNQEKYNILNNKDYNKFVSDNDEWLIPYAAFSYLRDKYGTADFSRWEDFAVYNYECVRQLAHPNSEAFNELNYFFFLQFLLDSQFSAVAKYARSNRIILKGDIPIGVNRESVETWTEPHLFNMQQQSGAPPDDFSETGQNWSFPTYNWDKMEQTNYAWWKRRLRHLNRYFDAVRIDHILGFFRIWEIPVASPDNRQSGLLGHFNPALPLSKEEIASSLSSAGLSSEINLPDNILSLFLKDPYDSNKFHPLIAPFKTEAYLQLPDTLKVAFNNLYHDFFFVRHNAFWKHTALKRLKPLIDSSNMLICGEDLGMLPATVYEVMCELQILSLELGRISKHYGIEFSDLTALPYLSVCTTSTHDMNTVRAWWKEDPERTQRYYNQILKLQGEAPTDCSAEIVRLIIAKHVAAPSMLTVIPIQDFLAADERFRSPDADTERINVPSNPENYWRYRIHLTVEQLLSL